MRTIEALLDAIETQPDGPIRADLLTELIAVILLEKFYPETLDNKPKV